MSDPATNADRAIYSGLVENEPGFEQVVRRFVDGLPARVSAMQQALKIEDLQGLRMLAHQLKGSGSGHGYPLLTEKAADLEQHALQQDICAIGAALADLRTLLTRIRVRP